jgi:WD40 repeat protein
MRLLLTLSLAAALPTFARAQQEPDEEKRSKGNEKIKIVKLDRKEPVVYEKDVEPIFYKRCIACHSGNIKESRFDISSYEGVVKGGKRGTAIVPGKAESSLLYTSCSKLKKPYMPPKGEEPITPEELALIKLWIDQGAKAPSGARAAVKIVVGLPPANVHPVRAVAVSPDKSAVAAGRGNQIHVYDAGSGKHVRTLLAPDLKTPDGKPVQAAHLSLVEAMTFSPDGRYLASGSFQEVNLWDAQTGRLTKKLTGFAHNVVALAFSPDGKLLATGGGAPTEDGEVKVFEVGSWNQLTHIKGGHSDTVYGVCFSPDGKKLASCGADKFIKVFELPEGKFVKSFEGHTHQVLDVGWYSDGKLLASAGADNTVKVWDYEKGEQVRTINAHTKQVTRLTFVGKSPNFATCSGDGQVRFWNVQNGGNTRNFGGNKDFVYAVSVTPDGSVLAAGGEEGVIRLYNGTNGQLVRSLLPPGEKK